MRSVEFHREAQDEFISAAQYFEAQTENLGLSFISAVQRASRRESARLLIEVDGLIVDVRTMPPEIQEEARRRGLIPDLP